MKIVILALSALALSTVSSWSGDKSPSGTLQVKFKYGTSECQVDLGEGVLNFGTPDKLNDDIKMTATIRVKCPKDQGYWVALNGGDNPLNGHEEERRMKSADGNFMAYALCKDSGCEFIWGFSSVESSSQGGKFIPANVLGQYLRDNNLAYAAHFKADGTIQSHTVYGLIKSADLAKAPAGAYADKVTITVKF
ncbi:Csu type fimbrial protein [Phyllobacterium myrsinacearum]|uniref:Spore coat protein U/FanG domain-containing protein n=1 Tax=Phyllobacterium myrsinacearum TaxID=28101 RepID=A0A2S9JE61_9HYPH|nr:spore coat U domain-containing protein [Phyllobacterium myrsinacearum]PRD51174.1 hypothetical protein C5750_20305 [Phyllobacterium myrsinacearum]PWV86617.1 spore coat protein U-like protein [Phyllobacterium myrsinacearum]RZU97391.1 spore coat protein U-like protein [Phyllobacterium myrsinacearum]